MVKIISLLIFKLNFLNPVISLLFYTPLTGFKVVNALNTCCCVLLTAIYPAYLHLLISVQPFHSIIPHLLLPSLLDHLCDPHYKSPITSLVIHYLVSRIRDLFCSVLFLLLFFWLPCISCVRWLLTTLTVRQYFTSGLKLAVPQNPYHYRLLMSHQDSFYRPGLRTDLLCWSVSIFFFDFFITVLCSRLS